MSTVINCKLAEYTVLFSNKVMWGMDCDIKPLLIEMYKLYSYKKVLNSLEFTNDCVECGIKIPSKLKQKIEKYELLLSKTRTKFCRHC